MADAVSSEDGRYTLGNELDFHSRKGKSSFSWINLFKTPVGHEFRMLGAWGFMHQSEVVDVNSAAKKAAFPAYGLAFLILEEADRLLQKASSRSGAKKWGSRTASLVLALLATPLLAVSATLYGLMQAAVAVNGVVDQEVKALSAHGHKGLFTQMMKPLATLIDYLFKPVSWLSGKRDSDELMSSITGPTNKLSKAKGYAKNSGLSLLRQPAAIVLGFVASAVALAITAAWLSVALILKFASLFLPKHYMSKQGAAVRYDYPQSEYREPHEKTYQKAANEVLEKSDRDNGQLRQRNNAAERSAESGDAEKLLDDVSISSETKLKLKN